MFSLLPAYAELHCLSNFSFLRGASHAEELVARAHQLGYHSLAITDECSLAGVVRAHVEAEKCKMRLIIGSEMRLVCGLKLVLLAMSREGYGNLSEWISVGRCRAPKGSYDVRRSDVGRDAATRLRGLPECLALFVPDADPLVFYRALGVFARERLLPNGAVFVETHEDLAADVAGLFTAAGLGEIVIRKDMQGKERMVGAKSPPGPQNSM